MEEFSQTEKKIISALCSGRIYTTYDHAFILLHASLSVFSNVIINNLSIVSLYVSGYQIWIKYEDDIKGEDYTEIDTFLTTEIRKIAHCFERLVEKGYLQTLKKGKIKDWSESTSTHIKGYPSEGRTSFHVDFKDVSEFFLLNFHSSYIIVPDLFEVYKNNFKTIEQCRYENELKVMYDTLFWTRAAFVLALIAAILSLIINIIMVLKK